MTHRQTRSWADKSSKAIKTLWLLHLFKIKQTLSFEQVRERLWNWIGCPHKELHIVAVWSWRVWDSRSAGELGQYISGTVVSLIHRVPDLPAELVAVSDSPGFPPEFLRTGGNIPSVSAYTPYLPTSHVSFVLQYVLFPTSVHSWNWITEFSVSRGIFWLGSVMFEIRTN